MTLTRAQTAAPVLCRSWQHRALEQPAAPLPRLASSSPPEVGELLRAVALGALPSPVGAGAGEAPSLAPAAQRAPGDAALPRQRRRLSRDGNIYRKRYYFYSKPGDTFARNGRSLPGFEVAQNQRRVQKLLVFFFSSSFIFLPSNLQFLCLW